MESFLLIEFWWLVEYSKFFKFFAVIQICNKIECFSYQKNFLSSLISKDKRDLKNFKNLQFWKILKKSVILKSMKVNLFNFKNLVFLSHSSYWTVFDYNEYFMKFHFFNIFSRKTLNIKKVE